MTINHSLTMAIRMASKADVERVETYSSDIDYYRENGYSYIPLPADGLYYDVEIDELRQIHPLQYIPEDMPVVNVFEYLTHYPFLLIDSSSDYYITPEGVTIDDSTSGFDDGIYLDQFGWRKLQYEVDSVSNFREALEMRPEERDKIIEMWEDFSDYRILTIADVNKRQAKEAVYPIIAGLEIAFASELKDYYSNRDDELIEKASEGARNHWQNAKQDGIELHITEYMSLGELRHLVSRDREMYTKLGFSSSGNVINSFSSIKKKFRDRIMHTHKTLVRNTGELEELATELESAEVAIEAAGDEVEGREYWRYEKMLELMQ